MPRPRQERDKARGLRIAAVFWERFPALLLCFLLIYVAVLLLGYREGKGMSGHQHFQKDRSVVMSEQMIMCWNEKGALQEGTSKKLGVYFGSFKHSCGSLRNK